MCKATTLKSLYKTYLSTCSNHKKRTGIYYFLLLVAYHMEKKLKLFNLKLHLNCLNLSLHLSPKSKTTHQVYRILISKQLTFLEMPFPRKGYDSSFPLIQLLDKV